MAPKLHQILKTLGHEQTALSDPLPCVLLKRFAKLSRRVIFLANSEPNPPRSQSLARLFHGRTQRGNVANQQTSKRPSIRRRFVLRLRRRCCGNQRRPSPDARGLVDLGPRFDASRKDDHSWCCRCLRIKIDRKHSARYGTPVNANSRSLRFARRPHVRLDQ